MAPVFGDAIVRVSLVLRLLNFGRADVRDKAADPVLAGPAPAGKPCSSSGTDGAGSCSSAASACVERESEECGGQRGSPQVSV